MKEDEGVTGGDAEDAEQAARRKAAIVHQRRDSSAVRSRLARKRASAMNVEHRAASFQKILAFLPQYGRIAMYGAS